MPPWPTLSEGSLSPSPRDGHREDLGPPWHSQPSQLRVIHNPYALRRHTGVVMDVGDVSFGTPRGHHDGLLSSCTSQGCGQRGAERRSFLVSFPLVTSARKGHCLRCRRFSGQYASRLTASIVVDPGRDCPRTVPS